MSETGLKQVDILDRAKPYCDKYKIKLGKNDLSQYVNGKVEPGQEKLTILGLALNVSEAWLMGYDVPRERNYQPPQKSQAPFAAFGKDDSDFSEDEIKQINNFIEFVKKQRNQ